jgi:ligand-binding sensor domain-containing protein
MIAKQPTLFLLLLNCFISAFSQQHNFKSWSVESGIQSQVSCITQDYRGYIWIGTQNGGLALFDGKKFIFYTKENGLCNNNITALCEDKTGNMWVGTQNGIDKFDGSGFTHFDLKDSVWMDANKIRDIICDRKGRMWIATEDLVGIYDNGKFSWLTKGFGLSHRKVYKLFEDSKGNIWFGFKPGKTDEIDKYDGKKITHFKLPFEYGAFMASFAEDKSGKIWIGVMPFNEWGRTQIYTIENDKLSGFIAPMFDRIRVMDLLITRKGNLFIGTLSGVIKAAGEAIKGGPNKGGPNILIKNNSYTIMGRGTDEKYDTVFMYDLFDKRYGLPNNSVRRIFEDKEGNLWFGTDNGIVKFTNDKFLHFGKNDNIHNGIFRITEDNAENIWLKEGDSFYIETQNGFILFSDSLKRHFKDYKSDLRGFLRCNNGEIWFGTRFSDVLRISENKIQIFKREGPFKDMGVIPVCEDTEGNIWFNASNDGRSHFLVAYMPKVSPSKLIFFPDTMPYVNLHPGKNGELWLMDGSGLKQWKNGKIQEVEGAESLKDQSFYSPFSDEKGNLWMRNDANSGIFMYSGKNVKYFGANNGFTNEGSTSIISDKFKNVWIGSDGDGVFRFDGTSFIRLSTQNGLNNNSIMSLITDDIGNIWVGTNKGINKVELDKNGNVGKVRSYGYNEGFVGIECNQNAAFKDSKGCLWFGTSGVLTKYDPKEDEPNLFTPQINFTGLNLFYEKVDWRKFSDSVLKGSSMPCGLVLPHNQNHLTFSYVGVFHTAPESVRYKFMLSGDTAWSKETDKTEITYSNLAPGKYVFKVLAGTTDGLWNLEPTEFSFEILYPWWRRWWAYLLYVLLAFVSVFSFIRYRTKKLVAEKERLERIVIQRTAELMVQKEIVEEKNKEILESMRYASRIQRALITSEKYIHRVLEKMTSR